MIDSKGFRANVGIILCNAEGRVFWARRAGQNAWQFPQGGIARSESPRQAMYRELEEETGLSPADVKLLGQTRGWLRYRLPARYMRRRSNPACIGQKQRWFALRLASDERRIELAHTSHPEFDEWCWVDYWHPPEAVIFFKRDVYRRALRELAPKVAAATADGSAADAAGQS